MSLPRIIAQSDKVVRTKISQSVQLYCVIDAHPLSDYEKVIKWTKDDDQNAYRQTSNKANEQAAVTTKDELSTIQNLTKVHHINKQRLNITLDLVNIFKKDNGSYSCVVDSPFVRTGREDNDENTKKVFTPIRGVTSILVLDVPQVSLDFVKAVSSHQIFLNWTINDGNSPIIQYFVQYMKEGASTFTYYNHVINGKNLSYVLDNFEPNTNYQLKITAKNAIGSGPGYVYPQWVRTLDSDPVFVPEIDVKGNTRNTMTIGWHPPPAHLLEFIHYYELVVAESENNSSIIEEAIHPQNSRNLPYMFDNVSSPQLNKKIPNN